MRKLVHGRSRSYSGKIHSLESDQYELETHFEQTTCMTLTKLLNLHCETVNNANLTEL